MCHSVGSGCRLTRSGRVIIRDNSVRQRLVLRRESAPPSDMKTILHRREISRIKLDRLKDSRLENTALCRNSLLKAFFLVSKLDGLVFTLPGSISLHV